MSTEQDILDRLDRLERRREKCRRRAEVMVEKFETGANRISDALDEIAEASSNSPALADDFRDALEASAQKKMAEIDNKLSEIAALGQTYSQNLLDTDLDEIGTTTKEAAEAFMTQAFALVDTQIEALLTDALEDAQRRISDERDALLETLESNAERLETVAEDWKNNLSEAKDRLEVRLDELTEISIEDAWKSMGETMREAFAEDVLLTRDKLLRLHDKVTTSMEQIRTLGEAFGTARKAKDITVQSAGTSLEVISSIFEDLEAIFAAVK